MSTRSLDIRKSLLAEHSRAMTTRIITYVGDDPILFKILMQCFLEDDYRLRQRAAWALGDLCRMHPELLKPYFSKFVKKLLEEGQHDSIPRNILRVLQEVEIPGRWVGPVLDYCLKVIPSEMHAIAIRAFAITVAAGICKTYPELAVELNIILNQLRQVPQSAAITVRIRDAQKMMQVTR